MKCERCHQREATIHLSQTFQGKTVEQNLCETCARELGLETNFDSMFNDLFGQSLLGSNVFNTTGGIPAFGKPVTRDLACSHCGLTYEEFRKTGLFGCSHCYEAFADRLDQVFRRVQGGTRHVGHKLSAPAGHAEQQLQQQRLADLRTRQQQAVKEENYELAAKLRDEIKAIEQQLATEATDTNHPGKNSGKNGDSGKKSGGGKKS